MKNPFEPIQDALRQMAPRERVMVLAGAVVVAVTLLYLVLWEPLMQAHRDRQMALESARHIAQRIEQAAALLQQGAASGAAAVDRKTSLLTAVDQTSRSAVLGKAPSRVQPEGDKEVKIWIEDTSFDNMLRWLQQLQTRYGITPKQLEVERGAGPGLVSGRLSLVRE